MSDTPCLDSTDNILGQEFLTWLWFQSDVAPGAFVNKEGQPFSVSMEQRIVVQGCQGDRQCRRYALPAHRGPLRPGQGQKSDPGHHPPGKG